MLIWVFQNLKNQECRTKGHDFWYLSIFRFKIALILINMSMREKLHLFFHKKLKTWLWVFLFSQTSLSRTILILTWLYRKECIITMAASSPFLSAGIPGLSFGLSLGRGLSIQADPSETMTTGDDLNAPDEKAFTSDTTLPRALLTLHFYSIQVMKKSATWSIPQSFWTLRFYPIPPGPGAVGLGVPIWPTSLYDNGMIQGVQNLCPPPFPGQK